MKKSCLLILATILFISSFPSAKLKAEESDIGLTVGIDYVSRYLKNGQYHFLTIDNQGDSFIFPYALFDVFNTGLALGIKGEIPRDWIGGSKESGDRGYYDRQQRSADFNIDYKYNLNNIITFNIGTWYYRYITNNYGINHSYFDHYFNVDVESLPLTPTISATYTYYTNKAWVRGYKYDYDSALNTWYLTGTNNGKNEDIYLQFSLHHDIALTEITTLAFKAAIGFYNKKTYQPKPVDIGDIHFSTDLSTKWHALTITASLHCLIVPGIQFKNSYESPFDESYRIKDILRTYISLGFSYSI